MIYNNLIYFLVVIFTLSTDKAPPAPEISFLVGLPAIIFFFLFYYYFCGVMFRRVRGGSAGLYFEAEKKLSILAVLGFLFILYVFDLKFYLHPLSFQNRLPILENMGGLAFFFIFLILMWIQARENYQSVFNASISAGRFVLSSIRTNLPIILPWLALSILFDLLSLVKLPGLEGILNSQWGDLILFFVFVVFLMLFFPPLVRWLWDCKPLPDGPLRFEIEAFFRKLHFSSEILVWPLFEGQVITAGVMGFIPRFRYVLVTPALLQTMNWKELEAVLGHEIGHVKKRHLFLYVILFFGFSLFAGIAAEPLPYFILSADWFYSLQKALDVSPESLLALFVAFPVLVFMLVYFRFIFGYFIRNFERQADLHVFNVQGESSFLIQSFEKIALLSGKIRDKKSWHHFGIGERIAYLEKCEKNRQWIKRHDRKVQLSLALYFIVIALTVVLLRQVDYEEMAGGFEMRYVEAAIMHKLDKEEGSSVWFLLLGNLMQEKKMEVKAFHAYEKALQLDPMNPDVNNNLSWLLLTAHDSTLHDPARALSLAKRAAGLKEDGYILDTLAIAYWANGMIGEAVSAEARAMEVDPKNRQFYQQQLNKIKRQTWGQE